MEGATGSNSSSDKRCQNNASFYTKSSLRDFFTVLALSFHAVFEGLAVGLETDSKDVWLLFAGKLVTIQRNHWTGLVGSENGHFCLLSVHRGLVGQKMSKKTAYVIFEWSLNQLYCLQCNRKFSITTHCC